MMHIYLLNTHIFPQNLWNKVAKRLLADGITLTFIQLGNKEALMEIEGSKDANTVFIGEVQKSYPGYSFIQDATQLLSHRMVWGDDSAVSLNTFSLDQTKIIREYLNVIDEENFYNGIKCLAAMCGLSISFEGVNPVQTHGIYHPLHTVFFKNTKSYLNFYSNALLHPKRIGRVGILLSYTTLIERNTLEIDTIIGTLERNGFFPIPVFCENIPTPETPISHRYPWMRYFTDPLLKPDVILNLLPGRLLLNPKDNSVFKALDTLIIQLMRNYTHSPLEWERDNEGLIAHSIIYSLSQPEMNGVVEPSLVACVSDPDIAKNTGVYSFSPLKSNIDDLVKRLVRWVELKRKPNEKKKITIVLHNNPCKGVESTIGMAVGMDTFKSLSNVLRALMKEGYDLGEDLPGPKALHDLFFERKAFSEFRWTTVDEILQKKGVLFKMGEETYLSYFNTLPESAKKKIKKEWGTFPGEGMAISENGKEYLLITGLRFGNIQVIVQPKRGCYGAKCNGEVCRILHDPSISPPHHYLATYAYIQSTSDAVIHFGAEGSLEYLPGKRVALSESCFPTITLGHLPNIYLYVMDIPGEGLIAKRRGKAIIIDHLTPVYLSPPLDENMARLEGLLKEYQLSYTMGEKKRMKVIETKMRPLIDKLNLESQKETYDSFEQLTQVLMRKIKRMRASLIPMGNHTFGSSPDQSAICQMLFTLLTELNQSKKKDTGIPDISSLLPFETDDITLKCHRLESIIFEDETKEDEPPETDKDTLRAFCRPISEKITASQNEMTALIAALNGSFTEPGLGGSFYQGKLEVLPTGRNFYPTDISALPTENAWEVGKVLAEKLIQTYYNEENAYPENIGISIFSSDAFKSDGELLSQILRLLGVEPIWQTNGRVQGLKITPLEKLNRPRIDITIQASGILRDLVPTFCDLMDEAVRMVAHLDEPMDQNFVLKRTRQKIKALKAELKTTLSEKAIKRLATFRVFSSAPGTYGLGVGLALDASAWETQEDLAEIYINWGGYAYGSSKETEDIPSFGYEAHALLARQLKDLDISYMKCASKEYDLLDCGAYGVFMGGMALTGKALRKSKRAPKLYWGDAMLSDSPDVMDIKEEIDRSARTKLLNERWIQQMRGIGFKGAQSVANMVNNLYKLSATTESVEKWHFDEVVNIYIRNEKNLEWMIKENPYALEEITRRLLEANARGLWKAEGKMLKDLQSAALKIEGEMEETIGDTHEEFQGNRVDVMTRRDVNNWNPKYRLNKDEW